MKMIGQAALLSEDGGAEKVMLFILDEDNLTHEEIFGRIKGFYSDPVLAIKMGISEREGEDDWFLNPEAFGEIRISTLDGRLSPQKLYNNLDDIQVMVRDLAALVS